jgi:hypothetical protein
MPKKASLYQAVLPYRRNPNDLTGTSFWLCLSSMLPPPSSIDSTGTSTHASFMYSSCSTDALLNIAPLGAIICGESSQDRSAISRHFSHQILARAVQYLARLRVFVVKHILFGMARDKSSICRGQVKSEPGSVQHCTV